MILEEIDVSDERKAKTAIISHQGQQAMIKDGHNGWCHCRIIGAREETYRVYMGDARKERELHYHDIEQLIIPRNYPKSTLEALK